MNIPFRHNVISDLLSRSNFFISFLVVAVLYFLIGIPIRYLMGMEINRKTILALAIGSVFFSLIFVGIWKLIGKPNNKKSA